MPDVFIVLLYGVHLKTKPSRVVLKKRNLTIFDVRFPETIPGNFISTAMLCIAFARLVGHPR